MESTFFGFKTGGITVLSFTMSHGGFETLIPADKPISIFELFESRYKDVMILCFEKVFSGLKYLT